MAQLFVKKADLGVDNLRLVFEVDCGNIKQFSIDRPVTSYKLLSKAYKINKRAHIQIKININCKLNATYQSHHNTYKYTVKNIHSLIFIIIKKAPSMENDGQNYSFELDSKSLGFSNRTLSDDVCHLLGEKTSHEQKYELDLNILMKLECQVSLASMYDDDVLTDFELRGDDGSVKVHKAVLAASSMVLKQMLCGKWKENDEGYMVLQGFSQKTLQDLKNFMYRCSLPEEGAEHLSLLASQFMMENLMQKSAEKIVNNLTSENVIELLEFAGTNKLKQLIILILDRVQSKQIDVKRLSTLVQFPGNSTPAERMNGWMEDYDDYDFSE